MYPRKYFLAVEVSYVKQNVKAILSIPFALYDNITVLFLYSFLDCI